MSSAVEQRLRLLHVVPTYFPATRYGGPIHSVHGLCKALVRLGHQVDVYTTSVDGDRRLDVKEGVPVDVDGVRVWYFRSRYDRLYWSPSMRSKLVATTAAFDAVHLHSVFLWPTNGAARLARRVNIPYILSPRGMLVPELISARSALVKRAWIRFIERRTLREAARIHVTSVTEADGLRRCGLNLAPLIEIANGVDLPARIRRAPLAGSVLFLGRISWKKNLLCLVEAVSAIPGAQLTLAGPDEEGLMPLLTAKARELGCSARIVWIGEVGDARKRELFAQSACAVLPSLNENFGNVVVEALAHGCPVVVTPGVGARTVVEAANAGIVADGTDAAALSVALERLLSSPTAAATWGSSGAAYVHANLGWDAVASRMADVYTEMRDEKRGLLS